MDYSRGGNSAESVVVISRKADVIEALVGIEPVFLASIDDLSRRREPKAIILDRDGATAGSV